MRVVLVEDHLMMRDVLRRACGRDFGCDIVGECGSGAAAIEVVARARPDLIVLDLQLPDCDGLDLLDTLRQRFAAIKILVFSSRCDAFAVYRIDRARVSGFIDKNSQTVDRLGEALAAISAGGVQFSPTFLQMRAQRRGDPHSFDKVLSDREQEVLLCLAAHADDRAVAQRLGIAPDTAAKHRFNLLRKLDLKSTPDLLRYAREQGFASGHPPLPRSPTR